jgi:hypothetical protein
MFVLCFIVKFCYIVGLATGIWAVMVAANRHMKMSKGNADFHLYLLLYYVRTQLVVPGLHGVGCSLPCAITNPHDKPLV